MRPLSRLLLPALVSLALPVAAAAQATAPAGSFDAYATKAVRDWNAVGLAVAVVKDGQIVFARGYGVRELGRPDPVDTATLFAIGSTTKAMTAAALGMLVDEGKVRWDDPVTRHLPGFQMADPWVTREVTVRDLLTHRAGLGNADLLWFGTATPPVEIVRRVRFIPAEYSLRSSFIYQNIMYAVAGEVVAAASGMSWHDFIRTRILTPLGMSRTVTTLAATKGVPNVASPHDRIDDTVRVIRNASVDGVAAAGSIWSSVADMSKWLRFMLDSGRVGGKALLKPATFAELLKPQTMVTPSQFYPTASLTRPHWTTYSLGWFQQDYAGRAVTYHTGSIDGMVAIAGMIPDQRLGVFVLGNLDHVELRHALMFKAFDLWTGTGSRDWSAEMLTLYGDMRARGEAARKKAESERITGTRPSLALEKYAGSYTDSLYGTIAVTHEKGALRLRRGTAAATLEHWQYETFRARWDDRWNGATPLTFTVGRRGDAATLDLGGTVFSRVREERSGQ